MLYSGKEKEERREESKGTCCPLYTSALTPTICLVATYFLKFYRASPLIATLVSLIPDTPDILFWTSRLSITAYMPLTSTITVIIRYHYRRLGKKSRKESERRREESRESNIDHYSRPFHLSETISPIRPEKESKQEN